MVEETAQPAEMNQMKPREMPGQERFDDLVARVARERGWSPRKAKRFIDSVSKKETKKFLKKGLANRAKMEREGTLITMDPSGADACQCGGHFDDEVPSVPSEGCADEKISVRDE